MITNSHRFFIFLLLHVLQIQAVSNLEERAQDFIIETKKIDIPNYWDAFNPSIIEWQGHIFLCFRIRDPLTASTGQIGFIKVDRHFNLLDTPQVLEKSQYDPYLTSMAQDPRLIVVDDHLYMVYNNIVTIAGHQRRRMFIAELYLKYGRWFAKEPTCLLHFSGQNKQRHEKNWIPFNYANHLLLAYSLSPHYILRPLIGHEECELVATTQGTIQWKWGELRGGTPALLDGDHYLAFFHSCKTVATVHSEGKEMPHYFIGAYLFSAEPPFAMTHISPEPIIGKNFYEGPAHKTWKPIRVVFPGGFIMNGDFVWLVYGRQDHEIWVAKINKQKLLHSLTPVFTLK